MVTRDLTEEQQLAIVSKAWGKQSGYCFFPTISGTATNREERIRSYSEGPAYLWPRDRAKIIERLKANRSNDIYWCPSLFEAKARQMELAMDEHALWADLDEVDPTQLEDYQPTIAWETSPGRYQALWLITGGDIQGASWQGGENQRMTYYLGADVGGWDTTQLLRLPGAYNHKPDHREENGGKPVQGKLLWQNGRRYLPDDFEDLPEVQTMGAVQDLIHEEIDRVDRHQVWGRVRLLLPHKAREQMGAKDVDVGSRSETLWWLMRCLADVGCSAIEIVAVVRPTAWNKFAGRQDELKRLTIEAHKAISARSEEKTEQLEEEHEAKPRPQNLFDLVANVKQPEWLIATILAKGACGFIAGQPKSFKSWVALDLILSVATGIPFLDHFPIREPGPVLYIQEEDALPMVKSRLESIWPSKQADKMAVVNGQVVWEPADPRDKPPINAMVRQGITISDPGWQSWVDEELELGYEGIPYVLLILDPLMMVAGDVEENRSQEMTNKIFKPLKQLAEKHNVAVLLVHHMKKGDSDRPQRGGQLMLGSVANHAWAEDSMYLRLARGGDIVVERESKHVSGGAFKLTGLRKKGWYPTVTDDKLETEWDQPLEESADRGNGSSRGRKAKCISAMEQLGAGEHATRVIAEQMSITNGGAYKQLQRQVELGKIEMVAQGRWKLVSAG